MNYFKDQPIALIIYDVLKEVKDRLHKEEWVIHEVIGKKRPLISGTEIPAYWSKIDDNGNQYIFLAQSRAKNLVYPVYSGQSFMQTSEFSKKTRVPGL